MREIIKGELTAPEITFMIKGKKLNYDEVILRIDNYLKYTLKEIIFLLEIWINNKVPKDTGNLRQDLLNKLHTSEVKDMLLELILATDVEYAKYVNAMSTFKVRHFGQKRGSRILNDPQAEGEFLDKMVIYAKENMMSILAKAKDQYF